MSRAGKHLIYLRQQLLLSAVPGFKFQSPRMARDNYRGVNTQSVMLPTQRQHEHMAHAPPVLQNVMYLSVHVTLMRGPADDAAQRLHGLHVGFFSLGH
jgi:transposase